MSNDPQSLELDEVEEIVVREMGRSIDSRHQAADILRKVAEYGQAGCFPNDVTCEELGRALFRITMNAPEEEPFPALVKGYYAAESERYDRLLSAARGR